MRRFIAFILSAILILAAAIVPATAADVNIEIFHNQSDVANSTVVHGVNLSYTVTIPDKINMAEHGVTEVSTSVTSVYLPRANAVVINLSSANYSDDSWQLLLDENNNVKLSYSIKNGGEEVTNGGEILSCAGGTAAADVTLSFEATGEPGISGPYSDTLTFIVSVKDINN